MFINLLIKGKAIIKVGRKRIVIGKAMVGRIIIKTETREITKEIKIIIDEINIVTMIGMFLHMIG